MLNPAAKKHYSWSHNLLRMKSKLLVPQDTSLRNKRLEWLHYSGTSGHSGRDVTHQRVKRLFYWKGMIKDIQTLAHPYSASFVAQAYIDNIFKLHGFPKSIISDRDSIFLSEFWQELFTLQGVSLNLSSTYHPQTDRQTEVVRRCIETYLRCMTSDRPHCWSKWLPLAEFWYNTSFQSATQLTPYEVVYGQAPPPSSTLSSGESKVDVVAKCLQERENMIRFSNSIYYELSTEWSRWLICIGMIGTLLLVIGCMSSFNPYRQLLVVLRSSQKLAPRYYGPYKIIDKLGKVAYKLDLPASSQIHFVFHVSQLKQHIGSASTYSTLPFVVTDVLSKEPKSIIERKMVNRQGRAATKVLVKWTNQPVEEANWEFFYDLLQKYPNLQRFHYS
ncbi:hypothetical protein V2J09_006288 [Rumex salicifolius]